LSLGITHADFQPSSYKSIEECVLATGVETIFSTDPLYNDVRVGEMIIVQRYPKLVTYPKNSTQVQWLVLCSKAFNIRPCPRDGGHSNEGYSNLDGSVVIDISKMIKVVVNEAEKTAIVDAGIRLGTLYIELARKNFTIVSGYSPTIGLSGIIASGGFGMQSRNYGVTGDFVVEASVVLANGSLVVANSNVNSDLFWALRGGGGAAYGIVTQWKLKLIPGWSSNTVFTIDYKPAALSQVLGNFTLWGHKAPANMSCTLFITKETIKMKGHYLGDIALVHEMLVKANLSPIPNECEKMMACDHLGSRAYFLDPEMTCKKIELLNIGTSPLGPNPFNPKTNKTMKINSTMNSVVTQGVLPYYPAGPLHKRELVKVKSMYFNDSLSTVVINDIVMLVKVMPIGAIIELTAYGGILSTQPGNITAFVHRIGVAYHLLITVPLTGNSKADAPNWAWIKKWDIIIRPFSNHQSYQGFLDPDLPDPGQYYFGENLRKLQEIKSKYDPNNVFSSGTPALGDNTQPPGNNTQPITTQDNPDTFIPGTCPWVSGGNPPGRRNAGVGRNDDSFTLNKSRSSNIFNLSSVSGSGSSSSQRSDNGGEGEALTSVQDIEYWLQRCSICFDAQLDFCLDLCRDQFCRDCFQRYVKEVVQNSWGLSITKIKCPVCQDVVLQSEWSKPYRSFSRCCSECGEEVFAAQVFQVCAEEKEKYFREIAVLLRKYLDTYGTAKNTKGKSSAAASNHQNNIDAFIERYQKDYMAYISGENPNIGVMEMYEYVAKKLCESLGMSLDSNSRRPSAKFTRRKLKIHADMVKSAAEISSRIVALEVRPDAWKELQFMHVANFPQSHCTRCNNDICLQCGESTHHPGMTCIQFMRYKVANPHLFVTNQPFPCHVHNDTLDALENIKWKLANSKSCPNCSILINRDDGCNKQRKSRNKEKHPSSTRRSQGGAIIQQQLQADSLRNNGIDETDRSQELRDNEDIEMQESSQNTEGSEYDEEENYADEDDNDHEDDNMMISALTKGLDDRPEIGVPNVFMIQSKLISTTSV
ncbi:15367_t:CDS:10, partial [Acaulospora colombiana]